MATYIVQDRETGNIIEECPSRESALSLIAGYEAIDRKEGIFAEGFYEIVIEAEAENFVTA